MDSIGGIPLNPINRIHLWNSPKSPFSSILPSFLWLSKHHTLFYCSQMTTLKIQWTPFVEFPQIQLIESICGIPPNPHFQASYPLSYGFQMTALEVQWTPLVEFPQIQLIESVRGTCFLFHFIKDIISLVYCAKRYVKAGFHGKRHFDLEFDGF
uniref:Uncharacterized protein n=1 Tax=Clytia hemisphaerica TaxID=252671 RepID=A0A7M5WMD6_9CNID